VARELNVSRTSVKRWYDALVEGGIKSLKRAKQEGAKPKLNDSQKKTLVKKIQLGAKANGYATDLWTLKRVAAVIYQLSGQNYTEAGVWYLLRELGFSNQRPTTKAIQRDEQSIKSWKRNRWPLLKKTPHEKSR
jgi:transposase